MSPKRVLVTGDQGFIGSRLVPALQAAGFNAQGLPFDLLDYSSVEQAIQSAEWDTVVHLAAVSYVPTCEKDPGLAYCTNLNGTALILEAVRKHCPSVHLIFASSAQVYAAASSGENSIWDESRTISPQNVYARTKLGAELLIEGAACRSEVRATVLRLFNHTHKSQAPEFFLPHLYSLMKGADGSSPVSIPVGNLNLYRDIGGLSDLLAAFVAAAKRPPERGSDVFNICSGTPKHLEKLALTLATQMGVKTSFQTDPNRLRVGESKKIQGSHEKFTRATGWMPTCKTEADLASAFLA